MQPEGHEGFRSQPGPVRLADVVGEPVQQNWHPFSFSSSAEAKKDGRVEMTIQNLATSRLADSQIAVRPIEVDYAAPLGNL